MEEPYSLRRNSLKDRFRQTLKHSIVFKVGLTTYIILNFLPLWIFSTASEEIVVVNYLLIYSS